MPPSLSLETWYLPRVRWARSHKPWLDNVSSHGLITYEAVAWQSCMIKPWLANDVLSSHGLIDGLIICQAMAWKHIKPWFDNISSHGLITNQAMACWYIKPWLDMLSSQGLIYYQAIAWYINKRWLDLLSNHGLTYYQTMAWYVFKPWLDILGREMRT